MCARLRSMSSVAILQQLARLKKSRPRARGAIRHQDRNSEESCSAGRRLTKRRIFIARYAYSHSPGAAAEWLVEFIENPQHTCWGRGIRRTQLLLCGRARARDVLNLGHIELSFASAVVAPVVVPACDPDDAAVDSVPVTRTSCPTWALSLLGSPSNR